MTITYDLDCGDETITLELLDDGTLICHSIDFDIEEEMIAREMGFKPHPCFEAMDNKLWRAARLGKFNIVEILLAAGADVHANNNSALRWAAIEGHADVVELLLEYGADIHAENDIALQDAAWHNRADVVKLLLEYGADVHAVNDAALRWAAENGHDDVVAVLKDWIKDHG